MPVGGIRTTGARAGIAADGDRLAEPQVVER